MVSLRLANGRSATNQLVVPVVVDASDDLSGITSMAFSADGTTYGDWQAFAPSTAWAFNQGDGHDRCGPRSGTASGSNPNPRSQP